jgi:hypothetical protein
LVENREKGLSDKEIIDGCLLFLNKPPPRKRKPLYGSLQPVQRADGAYEVKEKDGNYIVCFSTDQRRNKNFWGDGPVERAKEDGRKTRWKK